MATSNQIGLAISGQSGTGAFIGSTSGVMTTPVLGAATCTSLTLGGSAWNTYSRGIWTPTFTFATPGNLSVSYGTRTASYIVVGNSINTTFTMVFTPTFTTSSGNAIISGFPFTAASSTITLGACGVSPSTYPVGTSYTLISLGATSNAVLINGYGSGVSFSSFLPANFTSGTATTIYFNLTYKI